MRYKFVTDIVYNKPSLTMEFEGKYSILTNIFMEIVLNVDNKESWLSGIDESRKGDHKEYDFGVPGFGAEVIGEKTIIYCDFTDEEIEITTEEFRKISSIWFETLEKFTKTRDISFLK